MTFRNAATGGEFPAVHSIDDREPAVVKAHYTPPPKAGAQGRFEMSFVGAKQQQLGTFGARDFAFVQHAGEQLAALLTAHLDPTYKGEVPMHGMNAMLQAIDAMAPKDEAEALFAVQAAAMHHVALDCLARAIGKKDVGHAHPRCCASAYAGVRGESSGADFMARWAPNCAVRGNR